MLPRWNSRLGGHPLAFVSDTFRMACFCTAERTVYFTPVSGSSAAQYPRNRLLLPRPSSTPAHRAPALAEEGRRVRRPSIRKA
jgi:hypothetical protein